MVQGRYVFPFSQLRMTDVDRVGGKNASLGELLSQLTSAGIRVPDGFATTAEAFRLFIKESGLETRIAKRLEGLDVEDVHALAEAGAEIRRWVEEAPFPAELEKEIREFYDWLKDGQEEISVAVRSSATAEDLPDASFAGQQETFLNVVGIDQVLSRMKEVFASLYNDRAISYRVHKGFTHMEVALSAGVQRMCRSDKGAAGVMFTLDTESGFDQVVFVTASYGLGETVVQGAVNPDEFFVFKPALAAGKYPIVRRNLGSKLIKMEFDPDKASGRSVRTVDVDPEDRRKFALTDEDVIELAKFATIIEKHYGRPMDIEWGKDGIDGKIYILQARPETVKSRQNSSDVQQKFTLKTRGKVLAEGRAIGQKIGEPGGFVSAPIHASVSGTVKAVEPRPFSMGGTMMSVVIENDFQNTVCPDIHPVEDPDSLTPEQLVEIVKNAGIVGQGGATFPTHVKISSGLGKVDYVIINAAECEPYITGDHRTMLERPEQVVKGATLLAKCFGVEHVYIGIEANKQNAADVLNKTIAELNAPVVVEVLHTRYPQGAEKQLCQAVSGRQVPSGKLPADAGCCIFNLNTTCAIYRAVYTGMPVVNKIVTVSGSGVIEPKNIECPIGTPISKLFDACGGLREDTYKLIMGGPMMGLAQYNVDVTVGKGTGAMLAFAGKEEQYEEHPQCIRCGKCVGVCPMRLEPVFMYKYLMKGDVDTWQNTLHGMDCIECGACTYICPARLPLIHAFRMGKQKVNNARMAAKAKAEAEKAAAEKKEA